MFLPVNATAPRFSLTAQGSNRKISLSSAPGDFLLIFHGYQMASVAAGVIRTVREVYPRPDQVLIASVADLRAVPRLLRGPAKSFIRNAYKEAAKQIPAGQDPADHIIILADWSGALHEAYQAPPTNRQVAMVLINHTKAIAGHYSGAKPGPAALALLNNELLK